MIRTKNIVKRFFRNISKNRYDDSVFYGVLYVFFAVPLLIFMSFKQPVFYTPDEPAHFARAYQVANGVWFPTKHEVFKDHYDVGGMTERDLVNVGTLAMSISRDKNLRLDARRAEAIESYRWSEDIYYSTPNVAIYPPFLYLPQALGVVIGKTLDMSISSTTTLSRLVNAMIAVLISALSLFIARRGVVVLFVILMLPMTLAQFASTSQDALCLSLSALCAALFSRVDELEDSVSWPLIVAVSVLIILISTSRPPYLGVAAIFLAIAIKKWGNPAFRNRLLIGFSVTTSVVVLWALYVAFFVSVQFGPEGVSYSDQLKGILNSPISWFGTLFHTWVVQWKYIAWSFIGNLGYMDTPLPSSYYWFVLNVMLILITKSVLFRGVKLLFVDRLYRLLVMGVLFITVCGIYLVLYVSWTPVGNPEILGVQGRYLIPVALFLCLLANGGGGSAELSGGALNYEVIVDRIEQLLLVMFCIITVLVVPWAIAVRFY